MLNGRKLLINARLRLEDVELRCKDAMTSRRRAKSSRSGRLYNLALVSVSPDLAPRKRTRTKLVARVAAMSRVTSKKTTAVMHASQSSTAACGSRDPGAAEGGAVPLPLWSPLPHPPPTAMVALRTGCAVLGEGGAPR